MYDVMKNFYYSHLPPKLQEVSCYFFKLALHITTTLPENTSRQKALEKLLEAKDAAVRAALPPNTKPPYHKLYQNNQKANIDQALEILSDYLQPLVKESNTDQIEIFVRTIELNKLNPKIMSNILSQLEPIKTKITYYEQLNTEIKHRLQIVSPKAMTTSSLQKYKTL